MLLPNANFKANIGDFTEWRSPKYRNDILKCVFEHTSKSPKLLDYLLVLHRTPNPKDTGCDYRDFDDHDPVDIPLKAFDLNVIISVFECKELQEGCILNNFILQLPISFYVALIKNETYCSRFMKIKSLIDRDEGAYFDSKDLEILTNVCRDEADLKRMRKLTISA